MCRKLNISLAGKIKRASQPFERKGATEARAMR
jgi:hypothetical protein